MESTAYTQQVPGSSSGMMEPKYAPQAAPSALAGSDANTLASTWPGASHMQPVEPFPVEILLRHAHVPVLPSSFASSRIKPYLAVHRGGAQAGGMFKSSFRTRHIHRWRGETMAFYAPCSMLYDPRANGTDSVVIEMWQHRRFRRDILLGTGTLSLTSVFAASHTASRMHAGTALDTFVPLYAPTVSASGAMGAPVPMAQAAAGAPPIGYVHVLAYEKRLWPRLGQ